MYDGDLNDFLSGQSQVLFVRAFGCNGAPNNNEHGIMIADIRGRGYYSAIFLSLWGGIYGAASTGDIKNFYWERIKFCD